MLSERKYGALINNFSHSSALEELKAQGCFDFISEREKDGKCAFLTITVAVLLIANAGKAVLFQALMINDFKERALH